VHPEVVGDFGLVRRGELDDLSSRPKAAIPQARDCTPKWPSTGKPPKNIWMHRSVSQPPNSRSLAKLADE
jgi:hypothetical protein